jgi:hypothetical protein
MAKRSQRGGGKEKFWRCMLQRWRRSGLGVRAFCAQHGLSEPSFYAWRRIVAERDQESARADAKPKPDGVGRTPRFVPVRVIEATASIEVVLPRGLVVRIPRGFDADSLRQLLAILEEERPC